MKKNVLFLTMALVAMIFTACSNEDDQPSLTYSLKANPTSLAFAATGNEAKTITVESENVTWSATKEDMSADWLTVEFDEQQVTVTVADNNQTAERSSRIIITPTNSESNVDDIYIEVKQEAGEEPKPEAIKLKAEGLITYYTPNFLYSTNGCDWFNIKLYTEECSDLEFEWTPFGKGGYWSGQLSQGRSINLELFTEHSDDFFNPAITPGTYTAGKLTELQPMTMGMGEYLLGNPWPEGSRLEDNVVEDGMATTKYTEITGGKVEVKYNGESNYELYIEVTQKDGTLLVYEFSGELKMSNLGTPPYYTDLTDDLILDKGTFGTMLMTNSFTFCEGITAWDLELIDKNVEVLPNGQLQGYGHRVPFRLFAPSNEGSDKLPEGDYQIAPSQFVTADPFTALEGTYDAFMGNSGSYWEQNTEDGVKFAPMKSGTISVKQLPDDKYSIIIDVLDDNENKISIEYEGEMTPFTAQQ